jgi:hypothetical protein
MRKNAYALLYWGALWGIAEATLGYVLHIAAAAIPGLPGFIMFPAAFFFMNKAYRIDDETKNILIVTGIAAMIKLSGLLVPGNLSILVLNPVLSILMEGLAVFLVMGWAKSNSLQARLVTGFTAGVLWRFIFLLYMLLLAEFKLPAGLVTSGLSVSMRFLFLESVINAILISAFLKTQYNRTSVVLRPLTVWELLAFSIVLQIAL